MITVIEIKIKMNEFLTKHRQNNINVVSPLFGPENGSNNRI